MTSHLIMQHVMLVLYRQGISPHSLLPTVTLLTILRTLHGCVLSADNSSFITNDSIFMYNVTGVCCSVMRTNYNSSFTISNCTFYKNSNINGSGTKLILYSGILLYIYNSTFVLNAAVQSDFKKF